MTGAEDAKRRWLGSRGPRLARSIRAARQPVIVRWPRIPQSWRQRTDWVPLDTATGQILRGLRIGAVIVFLLVLGYNWSQNGVPFDRSDLLLWIAIGLACACIGRHPVWLLWVLLDFVPFAAVLIVYDHLRGLSDTLGMPTWWHPQADVDRFLFVGHEPTVWLQQHLRYADVQWYDVAVCACYYSFFFLPYLTAGVMWLRSRADFYRWSLRFVGLSFFGFAFFVLIPSAPPWAAARCSAAQVARHPSNPLCMYYGDPAAGGLLGHMGASRPGTPPYIERIVTRGFSELHLKVATTLLEEGRVSADAVAAVPSLHLGGTVLFVLFMWSRLSPRWRPLLVAYPLFMTFSLVYTGEHYVSDCIAGTIAAFAVHGAANRIERRRPNRTTSTALRRADTLEGASSGPGGARPPSSTPPSQESPCPPSHPRPETMPSST